MSENPKGGKPQSKWHNYEVLENHNVGEIELALNLSKKATRLLYERLKVRVERDTGTRFKFFGKGALQTIRSSGVKYKTMQCWTDEDSRLEPDESPHTNRYDSPYSRVEWYIPLDRYERETS